MLVYVTAIADAAAINTLSVLDTMTKSNDAWRFVGEPAAPDLFTVHGLGLGGSAPVPFANGIHLQPTLDAGLAPTPDLVVVPGLADDVDRSLARNVGWVEQVGRWHRDGATVASSCTGAFVLAEAGLLDGRRATTHWVAAGALADRHPSVDVSPEAIVVDEGDVITSGGSTTAFNLVLYLIGRFGGTERANAAIRLMLLDSDRHSQRPFSLAALHRHHDDEIVHRAQAAIQDEGVEPLTVAGLAATVGVSSRTLARRFNAALSMSPQQYLEQVRIDAARRLLEETSLPVERIGERVGFVDPASFRRAFKRLTSLTPNQHRRRYGRRPPPGIRSSP